MSTSGEQENRPLTRRELRELRARAGAAAVSSSDEPQADPTVASEPVAPPAPEAAKGEAADEETASEAGVREAAKEDAAEEDAAPEADTADDDAAAPDAHETPAGTWGPNVVATSADKGRGTPPLTRRELRRLRTNEVPIVTAADDEPEAAPAPAESEALDNPDVATDAIPETPEESDAPANPDVAIDAVPEASEEPEAPADPDVAINVISEVRTEPEASEPADPAAPGGDADEPHTTVIPELSPTFGAGVGHAMWAPDESASFDDIMERHATTSPSSIIMTSSHRLADGIGSTGAATGTTDGRDVDAVLLDGELPPSSSPTPIAASAAISTQKAAHEVIRPPAPDKGRGLLMVLGITAGGLGIVAIGTLIALYFTGVFSQ